VLPQDHQLMFNCGGDGPLVGRLCPRLHHTQSVKFPLALIHGDPFLLALYLPAGNICNPLARGPRFYSRCVLPDLLAGRNRSHH
jgi:hypothetical protein